MQTDTTAGFCSKDFKALNALKNRALNTPCIQTFARLKDVPKRLPKKHQNMLRRSARTSFIVNGFSFRVPKNGAYKEFLRINGAMYSTSANKTKQNFCLQTAKSLADLVVGDNFYEAKASKIYKLTNQAIKKLRS